jgi:hypothetical protein
MKYNDPRIEKGADIVFCSVSYKFMIIRNNFRSSSKDGFKMNFYFTNFHIYDKKK